MIITLHYHFRKLKQVLKDNEACKLELKNSHQGKEKLESLALSLKETIADLQASKQKTEDENEMLKMELSQTAMMLQMEHEKTWWQNAGKFAVSSACLLQSAAVAAAYLALPAMRYGKRSRSTTDILKSYP